MPLPTNEEQLMLELINHLRVDPSGEITRLLWNAPSNVLSAIDFFGVEVGALTQQLNQLNAVAPLAWNEDLSEAAQFHNQRMIAADQQSHQVPGEPDLGQRAQAFGYSYAILGENIYAFAEDVVQGHAGFVIDWGYDEDDYSSPGNLYPDWQTRGDGMQDPPGHRQNLMNAGFTEIGIAATAENSGATQLGPLVVTQDLGRSQDYQAQFVGVAIDDLDADGFYDIGEGLGSLSIRVYSLDALPGRVFTSTWSSGGWQIAMPEGSYRVVFAGQALDAPISRVATLGAANVKIDIEANDEHALTDFNGDGLSDLLWRRSDGLLTNWWSTGTGFVGNPNLNQVVSTDWHVVSAGDYNGDGRVDLLWRNDDGRITNWIADGTSFRANTAFGDIVGNEWEVAASADFNGDSMDDILWRRDDGFTTHWLSTGTGFNGATGFGALVGNDWQVAGAADFDGDALDDILWQRSDGLLVTWRSTGSRFDGGAGARSISPGEGWSVSATGDFNTDGLEDVLLRHPNGRLSGWFWGDENAYRRLGYVDVITISDDWQIEGVADVNGDSRDDIIWRHIDGTLTYWRMTGGEIGDNPPLIGTDNPVFLVGNEWELII